MFSACSPTAPDVGSVASTDTTLGVDATSDSASSTAVETPPAVGSGQLIVTASDGTVSLVDPDTGAGVAVSEAPSNPIAVQPTPSPDGTVVIWSEVVEGETRAAVFEEGALRSIPVPTLPFFYLFSPDGTQVLALGNDLGGEGVAAMLIDLASDEAEIIDTGSPYFVDWSPASDRLVGHIDGARLAVVGTDGEHVGIDLDPALFQAPDWVNDGSVVAATIVESVTASRAALQTGAATLVTVDPGTGQSVALAPLASGVAFEVSPDGRSVAFIDGVEATGASLGTLSVVAIDGASDAVPIAGNVTTFEWSPDGGHLLFGAFDSVEGLILHTWDGESVTRYEGIVPSPRFVAEYLPFWSQYIRSVTQWAPDGSAFAYAAIDESGPGIWVHPLGGESERVADGDMVVWSP